MKCPEGTPEPKKPSNPYAFFNKHFKVPEGVKGVAERAKLASEAWRTLSSKEKAKYDEMVAEDRVRFEKQMQSVWLHGYYLLDDGTKSTDVKLKRSRSRSRPASEVIETATKKQKTEKVEKVTKSPRTDKAEKTVKSPKADKVEKIVKSPKTAKTAEVKKPEKSTPVKKVPATGSKKSVSKK